MMRRVLLVGVLAVLAVAGAGAAGRPLEVFFIDVEGGQSTLVVTPEGESLLIDAGYGPRGPREPNQDVVRGATRDPDRVMAAVREAGLTRIDYLLVTHFHNDHVGGIPELARRIPIGTFIDYGDSLGTDRMAVGGFRNYGPVREGKPHIVARPGDRLPLKGVRANVVSAGGELLSKPLKGGGDTNTACARAEDHPEDGTENYRSVGVMIELGDFRFLDLGDLSGNTLTRIVCPRNLLGRASVYLVAHHGDYDSNVPVLYAGVRPRVAVMNNSATKGGSPDAFRTLHAQPDLEDLWQLHAARDPKARNAHEAFIANVDEGVDGHWLRLTAYEDGSFRMVNGRTGALKEYGRRRGSKAVSLPIVPGPVPTGSDTQTSVQ
jgi:beta-lactamase superfamily II metal-dependent hydrolase